MKKVQKKEAPGVSSSLDRGISIVEKNPKGLVSCVRRSMTHNLWYIYGSRLRMGVIRGGDSK